MIRSATEVPLRAIVINDCPAHCSFCHFEGGYRDGRSLSINEIIAAAEVAAQLSIDQIQLTGGEPLLRKDIPDLVTRILNCHASAKISMTTNGFLLTNDLSRILRSCGLSKLSISLNPWLFEACRIRDPKEVEASIKKLLSRVSPFIESGALEFNFTVTREWLTYLPSVFRVSNRAGVVVDYMTVGWHPGINEDWYHSIYVKPSTVIEALSPVVEDIALRFEATPFLELLSGRDIVGRLKDPGISRQFRLRECPPCRFENRCPETSCAVRVYPGWRVGSCLLDIQRLAGAESCIESEFREQVVSTYSALSQTIRKLTFLQFGKVKQPE